MYKLITIILAASLAGCGAAPSIEKPCSTAPVPPRLKPYYDEFQARTGLNPSCVTIVVADDLDPVAGAVCDHPNNTIKINRTSLGLTDDALLVVVAHELGHCLLNRRHKEEVFHTPQGDFKKSLMGTPSIVGREEIQFFLDHKQQYFNELVTGVDFTLD